MAAPPKAEVAANDAAIAQMYKVLTGQMQQGVGATQQTFNEASSRVGAVYDDMTRALTQQANATASGLGGQLDMLGIGAATDSATQNLRGQLNQSLISAAQRRATEVSGLQTQGATYGQAGREGISNMNRAGVQVRGDYRTDLEEAIANLEAAKAEAQGQFDVQKLQGETQLAQMRAQAAARARSGGGGGRSGSPLDMLRAQLLGMQILEKQQKLEGGGGGGEWDDRGQGGLNTFLGAPSPYWKNQAGPKFRGELMDILDYAGAQSVNADFLASGQRDPYNIAMGQVPKAPSYLNQDALRQAIQIMYGKA